MYAALWRVLPGPWPVKALLVVLLAAVVVVLLFTVVFPWVEPRLPFNDSTIDTNDASGRVSAPAWAPLPAGAASGRMGA